jgi:uncharacterized membrane protein (UPF0127 family)
METPRTLAVLALVACTVLAGCGGLPGGVDGGGDGNATGNGTLATAEEESGPTRTPATPDGGTDPTPTGTATPAPDESLPLAPASATFREGGEVLAPVELEVADAPEERRRGLMNRTALPEDRGMVFVYEDSEVRSFWMKNTLIPLDMIFVAPNGTVLNVEHAAPQPNASDADLRSYRSAGPAQYVVEVRRGFTNRTGVGPGTTVEFEGLNGTDETTAPGGGE